MTILLCAQLARAGSHTFTEKSFKRKRVCDVCKENIDNPGAFCKGESTSRSGQPSDPETQLTSAVEDTLRHLTEMSSPRLPSLCLSRLPVRVNHAPYLCSPLTVCRMQGCSSQDMRSKGKPSLKSSQITRFAFLQPLSKLCSCVRGSRVLSGVSHVH